MTYADLKNSTQAHPLLKRICGLFLACLMLLATPNLYAEEAAAFIDQYGDEITFPTDLPIYSQEMPGPWQENAKDLEPNIVSWIRKSGLEDIRVLLMDLKNPFINQEPIRPLKALYVLDKDGIMIAYHKFNTEDPEERETKKIFVNGIINQLFIYTEYVDLGLWKKELRFEFQ